MILVGCSCSRMERHTSKPFDFGINKSHRISSGRLRNASSSPASPSFASRTFQSSRVKSCASTRRFSASSSMIKTRGIVGGEDCLVPSLKASLNQKHQFRSEEHTSELQSQSNLVCRLLLEKKQRTTP